MELFLLFYQAPLSQKKEVSGGASLLILMSLARLLGRIFLTDVGDGLAHVSVRFDVF